MRVACTVYTPCPVKAKLSDKHFVCRTTMVGPTGEDEMCNFYMMYWVEGKDTIQPNTCFTRWNRWGCTMMAWTKDPIVAQGTTHLVLGRSGSAGAWSRPWKHSWHWSFRPIKDLASGMASMACKSSRSDASHGKPLGTNMKCEYRQGWLHRPSYQAAPLLWPEWLISKLQKPNWAVFYQWSQRKLACVLKFGRQPKIAQNLSNWLQWHNITSNKLFIFPNIVSISANQVTQRSLPEFLYAMTTKETSLVYKMMSNKLS